MLRLAVTSKLLLHACFYDTVLPVDQVICLVSLRSSISCISNQNTGKNKLLLVSVLSLFGKYCKRI